QVRGGHTIDRAQSEDEALTERLALGQSLGRVDRQPMLFDEGAVARQRLRVAVTNVADEAAAARPRREVLAAPPVDLVVARARARACPVRDLVVLETTRAGRVAEPAVLRDRGLFGGDLGRTGRAPEASDVEREAVRRQVIGLPVEHAGEAAAPARDVEARQGTHPSHSDVAEAGLAGRPEGGAGAASVVEP